MSEALQPNQTSLVLAPHKCEAASPSHAECANCDEALQGGWCHACGQSRHDFHRSTYHLAAETLETLVHADGRLITTLRRLLIDPAGLTRDYLAGKRAPQLPPLRLFLVVLVILFFAGGGIMKFKPGHHHSANSTEAVHVPPPPTAFGRWIRAHAKLAAKHPETFNAVLGEEAHRWAFLSLPIAAFLLWLMFIRRRDLYLFDHLIFSIHSLSFQGLLIAAVIELNRLSGLFVWCLLAMPGHLFFHMRGVYQTRVLGTLIRMAMLGILSAICLIALLIGLIFLALRQVAG